MPLLSRSAPAMLTLVDVDFTLFKTSANVYVLKGDKVVKKLSSTEYNTYRLEAGEKFSYAEFRNATVFRETSKPIKPMIARLQDMTLFSDSRRASGIRDDIVILTARNIFDVPETFYAKFEDHGLDPKRYEFFFCGELHVQPTWVAKTLSAQSYIARYPYTSVQLWDDSDENLKGFLHLQQLYPEIHFEAYKVFPTGRYEVFEL